MEEREYIKKLVKKHKDKMNAAILLKWTLTGVSAGLTAALVVLGIAFIVPFYYANLFAIAFVAVGFIAGIVIGICKRTTSRKAALDIDKRGFKERVITAFEAVDKEDAVHVMQRKDAINHLRGREKSIKVKVIPKPRLIAIFSLLLLAAVVLVFLPSKTKIEARDTHIIHKEADKDIKKIQDVIDDIKEIRKDPEKKLTEDEKKKLDDMLKNLQASKKDLENAKDKDGLKNARDKADFKYDKISDSLNRMANAREQLMNDPDSA